MTSDVAHAESSREKSSGSRSERSSSRNDKSSSRSDRAASRGEKGSSRGEKSSKSSARASDKSERASKKAERLGKSRGAKAGGRSSRERKAARIAAASAALVEAETIAGIPEVVATPVPEPIGETPVDPVTPDPVAPEPEIPIIVDGPIPSPEVPGPVTPEPEIPIIVDGPIPAPEDPDPVDPETPEPEVPIIVDGPIPSPEDPDPVDPETPKPETPVIVDGPTPAPEDPDPAEPEKPVVVGDPDPVDRTPPAVDDDDDDYEPPIIIVGDPDSTEDGGGSDRPVAERPRVKPAKTAERPRPSRGEGDIPTLLEGLFGGKSTRKPTAQRPAVVVEAPVVEAPVVDAPVAAAREARAPAREPAGARSAPRIALSSGDGPATYRQYEISALGLTPKARQVVGALGFRIISERRSALLGNRVVAKLRTPRNETAQAALARVRRMLPEVTFDYSHLYRPSGDAPVPVRYPVEMVGAPADAACRIDAPIGLIDSGVGKHASLAGARITRRNFVDRDAATNVAHGTAIASILVGDLPGTTPLAPGAALFAANVFVQDGKNLRADAHAIIEALDWMAAQRVTVVNLSLMGPSNALLEAAVRAAAERGQVLVAAAGNDGAQGAPAYPAAYSSVIAVAAVDQRGRPYGRGNRGDYVYVAAPGVDIWGADARGGEAFWTGTSFAAPFVAAAVARDISLGRSHDINDGRARIAGSARDLGAPGRDPIYGYGLLQVGGCSGAGAPVLSSRD